MGDEKAALLGGIYHAAAMDVMNQIINPYDGLPEMRYNGIRQPDKTQLNKKQKKKRAAAKSARKARRKQRR